MRRAFGIVLALLLAACGGGEPTQPMDAGATGGGAAGGTPAETPKPAEPPPSAQALELNNLYRELRSAGADEIRTRAAAYDARSLPGDACFYLGMLHAKAEDHDKAAEALLQYLQKAPGHKSEASGRVQLVDSLIETGRLTEAEAQLTALVANFAEDAEKSIQGLGLILAAKLATAGELAKAAAAAGRAFEAGSFYGGEEQVAYLQAAARFDEARQVAAKLGGAAGESKEEERAKAIVARAAKIGQPAPAIEPAAWVNPSDFTAERLAGKVVVVYTWTTMSYQSSTAVEKLLMPTWKAYHDQGLVMVGLSQMDKYNIAGNPPAVDESMGPAEEKKNLENWVFNSHKWHSPDRNNPDVENRLPWPLALAGDDKLLNELGYLGIQPTVFVIDKAGRYRYFHQGHAPENFEVLKGIVGKLVTE